MIRTDDGIFRFLLCDIVLQVSVMTKYLLGESLGRGTQSVVYRSRNPLSGQIVAVKQIFCPLDTGSDFPLTSLGANFREVSTLNQLMSSQHENVIQLIDIEVLVENCCWCLSTAKRILENTLGG